MNVVEKHFLGLAIGAVVGMLFGIPLLAKFLPTATS